MSEDGADAQLVGTKISGIQLGGSDEEWEGVGEVTVAHFNGAFGKKGASLTLALAGGFLPPGLDALISEEPDESRQNGKRESQAKKAITAFHVAETLNAFSGVEKIQFLPKLAGGLIAAPRFLVAGSEEDLVEFEMESAFAGDIGRQLGKLAAVFAGGDFVEDLAEAVNVRKGPDRAFGWHEPCSADHGVRFVDLNDQTDIGKFGVAVHENDVGGLDVTMNEVFIVKDGQTVRERRADFDAGFYREHLAAIESQGARFVGIGIQGRSRIGVIGQLHYVVESIVEFANL